jgi:hypothetical protein
LILYSPQILLGQTEKLFDHRCSNAFGMHTGAGRRHHRLQLRHVREPRRVASALGGAPGQLCAELHRHAGGSKAFADGLRAIGAGLDYLSSSRALELELIQPHMAQKPVLRGEVGAQALTFKWALAGDPIGCNFVMSGNHAVWPRPWAELPCGLARSCTVTPGGSRAFVDGLRASGAAAGEAGEVVEEGGGGGKREPL